MLSSTAAAMCSSDTMLGTKRLTLHTCELLACWEIVSIKVFGVSSNITLLRGQPRQAS
jgi:hypothetical protein